MTNDCQAFEADLSALLDGELAPERAAQVRAHAESCTDCGARLARLARLDALLVGANAPQVPASLRTRLAARVAAEDARVAASAADTGMRRAPGAHAPRRAWRSRAAGAAAAAAAGLALYLAVSGREPGSPASQPSPVQVARPQAPPVAPAAPQIARQQAPASPPPAPPVPSATPPAARVERAAPPPPAPEAIARRGEPAMPAAIDLDAVPDEDLGIALELDTVEDFEEIANLELLELMLANEAS